MNFKNLFANNFLTFVLNNCRRTGLKMAVMVMSTQAHLVDGVQECGKPSREFQAFCTKLLPWSLHWLFVTCSARTLNILIANRSCSANWTLRSRTVSVNPARSPCNWLGKIELTIWSLLLWPLVYCHYKSRLFFPPFCLKFDGRLCLGR